MSQLGGGEREADDFLMPNAVLVADQIGNEGEAFAMETLAKGRRTRGSSIEDG